MAKKNITLKIDEDLFHETRRLADRAGTSISVLFETKLEQIVRERKEYNRAHKRALARLRKGFDLRWTPSPSRNELHER